uniref:Coat protein n=1 Tax=Saccharina latissima RNA virus 2 TaxID=3153342 RepID=A0AB38ZN75_9VIRU
MAPSLKIKRGKTVKPKQKLRVSGSGLTSLARLINDPCKAPLVAPQYGASSGGYLTKLSSFSKIDFANGSDGWLVWFPDYHGRKGIAGQGANIFVYQNDNAVNTPNNTSSNPLGGSDTAVTGLGGWSIDDPAYSFVAGTIVQDARAAAACVKLTYTGRNDALAGRVGVLEGVPRDALLTGGGVNPPTITEMFNYAATVSRTPMDEVELKFRPSEGSELYRNATPSDSAFVIGDSAPTSIGEGTPTGVGQGIGFCWSGMDTSTSITLDFLKVLEWRPEFQSGLVSPPQHVADGGGNMVSRAIAYLDRHFPGWQHNLGKIGSSVAARIAQTAFKGPANDLLRIGAAAAPMLL